MGGYISGVGVIVSSNVDQGTTAGVSLKTPVVISDTTLAAPAASIDVTSIPTGYKWIEVIWCGSSDQVGAQNCLIRLNNDSGNVYDYYVYTSATANQSAGLIGVAGATNVATAARVTFYNTTANEIKVGTGIYNYYGNPYTGGIAVKWHPVANAEISRITIYPAAGNFEANSRFTILGIK